MRNGFSAHLIAFVVFLIAFIVGLQVALGGRTGNETFGWAILFSIPFGIPALVFVYLSYAVFIFIRWRATLLLTIAAIVIFFFFAGFAHTNWSIALAVVSATILHQTILLATSRTEIADQGAG